MCKVSIIIPCYNVNNVLIKRCLSSINSQTFSDFEVIIVDDGSDPVYREILCKAKESCRNVVVFHQENKGVSAARNLGIIKARGKYIIFVDADDYLTSEFLKEAVSAAETYHADIIMGMNMTTYTETSVEPHEFLNGDISILENDEIKSIKKWMLGRIRYQSDNSYLGQGPWNKCVSRQLALNTLFNEELSIGEDVVWNLQLLQKARKVCIVNRVWYIYYMNPISSSRKYRQNAIRESYDSLIEIRKYLDVDDDEQYLSYCLRCWGDLKRIYRCYLAQTGGTNAQQKRFLFENDPWNVLASKRFKKLCNFKYRLMRKLYLTHLLFAYYHIKMLLSKNKTMDTEELLSKN